MSAIAVTRVIPAAPARVWQTFANLEGRRAWLPDVIDIRIHVDGSGSGGDLAPGTRWRETRAHRSGRLITEDLVVVAVEPGRRAVIALAGEDDAGELTYTFAPIEVGHRRGGTTVTVSTQRRELGLANRVLSFLVAGFAARTAEGALRSELVALEVACRRHTFAVHGAVAA